MCNVMWVSRDNEISYTGKVQELITEYKRVNKGDCEKAAALEQAIVRQYLAAYGLPDWLEDIVVNSLEDQAHVDRIIFELQGEVSA
ncbi:hypothetical protein [Thalassobacillus devorans]|uniref:hypothetical protein n=1 Tax=Thalassobacillus devorans TaxID=279813 RepID=UPI000A1CA434|nr:hypothetical protein [Thalassobacillus devorans]